MSSSAPTTTTTASPTPIWISDDEIDCEWIMSKMKANIPALDDQDSNIKLVGAKVVDISNQQRKGERPRDGATLLLTLTFEQGQSVETMKETFVIKQVSNSGLALSRQLGLAREAFFFNDLAPKIIGQDDTENSSSNIIIPKIYYAYGSMEEGTKIVIMEDLSIGYIDSGILFGKGNPNNWNRNLVEKIEQAYPKGSVPTSYEVANQTFLSIAKVHATYWKDQSLLSPSSTSASFLRGAMWLQGKQEESWTASQGLIQEIWQKLNINDKNGNGGGGIDERIKWDPLVKQLVQKAVDGISWESQKQRLNTNTHWTLVHGDFWPGNIMLSTTDLKNLRLLDWEMTGLGSGPQDLGQYVISNMDPQERRDCEERLVRNYYDELVTLGLAEYAFEECWKEYTIGGLERWLWFLVYFLANEAMLDWAQFFHDQIAQFRHDHNIKPQDVTQPRP
mmetsp:Transcript_44401/g.107399  ORF Transcript_44401/g.107399 Transcript_44401/m.107399 type:complete len:448 (-) Transcript_44401:1669-3012(-)